MNITSITTNTVAIPQGIVNNNNNAHKRTYEDTISVFRQVRNTTNLNELQTDLTTKTDINGNYYNIKVTHIANRRKITISNESSNDSIENHLEALLPPQPTIIPLAVPTPQAVQASQNLHAEIIEAIWNLDIDKATALINNCNELSSAVNFNANHLPVGNNVPFEYQRTALIAAIEADNVPLVELLLSKNVDANVACKSKSRYVSYPLKEAVMNNNIKIIDLLYKKSNVNIYQLDNLGRNVITNAICSRCAPKTIKKLQKLGLSLPLSKQLVTEIELGHIWGINRFVEFTNEKNEKQKVRLAGITNKYSKKMTQKYLRKFVNSKLLNNEEKTQLEPLKYPNCTNQNLKTDAIKKLMELKIPYMIWGETSNHTIIIVLHDGMLSICNRGEGRKAGDDTTDIYAIAPDQITTELINSLKKEYGTYNEFQKAIAGLQLERKEGLKQKPQINSNCGWTSPKAGVHFIFHKILGAKNGQDTYKKFTEFVRENIKAKHRRTKGPKDDHLLTAIANKVIKRKGKLHPLGLRGLTRGQA
jgi:hypothetical protein